MTGMATNPSVLVSLPRELVERLAPGAIDRSHKGAEGFSSELERDAWFAGAVGKHVEQALTEIMAEANERRKALLSLLDNVVQNGET